MRVRQLQTHLQDQMLIYHGKMESLRGLRVALDATCWLRSIQMLKDPYADALGGCPPGLFGIVAKELENFTKLNIHPIFVFDGMVPPLQHQMFQQSPGIQHLENAWTHLANNRETDAQKSFAVATSRINSDICHFVYHFIKSKGYECIRAPYISGPQLAHLANENLVQAVVGQPGLLLYGIKKVVLNLDFVRNSFEWVELDYILHQWGITKQQFIESCLLAGTEYCLTYPYLNLDYFQGGPNNGGGSNFSFQSAVDFIKQMPLANWMATFPTEEMRNDHVNGYCVCKTLLSHCPVLNVKDLQIEPLSATSNGGSSNSPKSKNGPIIPSDLSALVGERLPHHIFALLSMGHISYRLPSVMSTGEWNDRQPPLIDSQEYRSLVVELEEYRSKTLGLIASQMPNNFKTKKIVCKSYFNLDERGEEAAGVNHREITPLDGETWLKWSFSKDDLLNEMKRQKVNKIDIPFCLRWHAHEFETDGPLIKKTTNSVIAVKQPGAAPSPMIPSDLNTTTALVNLMILETLDYISQDSCGMTVLGDVIRETPAMFQESILLAIELMKFGLLNGEPFEAPEGKPFPQAIHYPSETGTANKSITLLTRVLSLVPMRLKNDLWSAKVDFDLAAFHCLVRALNRTLRLVVEGCIGNVLSRDMSLSKLLPSNTQSPIGPVPSEISAAADHTSNTEPPLNALAAVSSSILPSFMLPRACLGIVAKFFLEYNVSQSAGSNNGAAAQQFEHDLKKKFPCTVDPLSDLRSGFAFWDELMRIVEAIAEPLGTTDMLDEMRIASKLLKDKRKALVI